MVPDGFVLDAEHFHANVRTIKDRLVDALPRPEEVENLFKTLPIADVTRCSVDDELRAFADAQYFAVRSSGAIVSGGVHIGEDGGSVSLAGQFESYLQVPKDRLFDAIRRCWASLFNARSVDRFGAHRDYVDRSAMSVLVQEMIPAAKSAVMMTVDPLGDGLVGAMELTLGPCQAIVGGMTSPDEAVFSRLDGRILYTAVGSKEHRVEYDVYGVDHANVQLLPNGVARNTLAVSRQTLDALVRLGHRIESIFGVPQDVELVITASGRIVVTQTRPVTTLPPRTAPFTLLYAA
jgi:pyruvate,water dikinase